MVAPVPPQSMLLEDENVRDVTCDKVFRSVNTPARLLLQQLNGDDVVFGRAVVAHAMRPVLLRIGAELY